MSEESSGGAGGVGKVNRGPEFSSRSPRALAGFMETDVFDSVLSVSFKSPRSGFVSGCFSVRVFYQPW